MIATTRRTPVTADTAACREILRAAHDAAAPVVEYRHRADGPAVTTLPPWADTHRPRHRALAVIGHAHGAHTVEDGPREACPWCPAD